MLWTALKTKPPPRPKISQRSRTSARTASGVPKARVFWVSTPPPQKTMSRPNSRFEPARVHARGRDLDGVEDVEAAFDEGRDQGVDGAAGVLERLPGRVPVDPVVDALIVGHVELAEIGDGAEGRLLRAEVRAADERGLDLVADPGVDPLEVLEGDLGLALEDLVDVGAAGQGRDVPFLDVPDAPRALELGAGDEGDVAERGPAEAPDDAAPRGPGPAALLLEVVEGRVVDRTELLEVVRRIELVVVDGLLADDGVEEEAVLGQAAGRRRRAVALRVDERVAVRVLRRPEVPGHEDLGPVVHPPRLPVLVAVAEHRVGPVNALDVDAEGGLEVVVDPAQHLVGLVDLDQALFEAVVLAEPDDALDVHAGDGRAVEVDGDPVGLAVVEGGVQALAAGHRHGGPPRSPRLPISPSRLQ